MMHHISKDRTHANAQAQFQKALFLCKLPWKNQKNQTALLRINLCKRTSLFSFSLSKLQGQQVKENMGK